MSASTTTLTRPPAPDPTRPMRRGAVVRVAGWSARHKWTALALWIAFVAASVVLGGMVGSQEISDEDEGSGASASADAALNDADFGTHPTEQVLIQLAAGGTLTPGDYEAAAAALAAAYGTVEDVGSIGEPIPSADGTSVMIPVELDAGLAADADDDVVYEAASDAAVAVLAQTESVATEFPDLRIEQVGDVSLDNAISEVFEEDFVRAEMLSIPITLIILVVAFGALIAASVPVMLALTSVAAAVGLSAFASYVFPSTEFLASVVLLIGMAVGVDYSLFYIRREREEKAKGAGKIDAIEIAAATSGRAVVISGLTVMVAMAGMFLAGNAVFTSFAVGTILVVAMAVVGSLTALPALLSIFGRWVDRPRVPLLWRLQRRSGTGRFWPTILKPVLAKPAIAFIVSAGLLIALALPALGMVLRNPGVEDLPRSIPEMQTYDRLTAAYPSEGISHTVAIWTEDGTALDQDAVDAAVADLETQATSSGLFAETEEPVTAEYSLDGSVAQVDLPLPYTDEDPRAVESLDLLRDDLLPATVDQVSTTESGVTGFVAGSQDFTDEMTQRLPYVIGFVLLLTLVVLLLAFRSLTIALTAIGLNLLSVAAAYGLLTLVFQNSWAEDLLGFQSNGGVVTWLPLFLFVILFGLSMDYHVFVVSRIREARGNGLSTREAIASGITSSAGTVTSAAIVMVGVFAVFATLTPLDFKQMGVGLAAAILIDATIVRAVLLPSAMALLGERNWWLPGWMQRLPSLDHA
ncbi:MAG: MMPL family transporter [Candidatus Nanopelagicales bacterium]